MSVVTSVMIAGGYGCDPEHPAGRRIIDAVNHYLTGYDEEGDFQRKHRPLVEVSDKSIGEKGFEASLWIGSFNYLRVEEFIGVYREAVLRYRSRGFPPQLFIQQDREPEKGFVEIDNFADAVVAPPPQVLDATWAPCDRPAKVGHRCTQRKGHEGFCTMRTINIAPEKFP